MAVPLIDASFTAGELAPGLWGRVDLGKYHIGLATERNMYVDYRGGAYSRAGTKFVGFSAQTGRTIPPRLITFQFNINQGLALEFGNHYMRVISNGAFVTNTPTNITGITNASPGVIHDVAHGYTSGTWVFLSGIGGMVELNGQTFIVVAIDVDHFSDRCLWRPDRHHHFPCLYQWRYRGQYLYVDDAIRRSGSRIPEVDPVCGRDVDLLLEPDHRHAVPALRTGSPRGQQLDHHAILYRGHNQSAREHEWPRHRTGWWYELAD